MYNFEHREKRGFAIELEGEEDEDSVYIGQVYGSDITFQSDTTYGAEMEFRTAVNGQLDGDTDDEG